MSGEIVQALDFAMRVVSGCTGSARDPTIATLTQLRDAIKAGPVATVGNQYALLWCDEFPTQRVSIGAHLYAIPNKESDRG